MFIIIVFILLMLVAYLYDSWQNMPEYNEILSTDVKVSIVIAFRNEASNLPSLLNDLNKLSYPVDLLDVILVNDHSDDESLSIAQNTELKFSKQILSLADGVEGKKSAINLGVKNSDSELIITTDADCNVQLNWVNVIANFYKSTNSKLIAGPVAMKSDNSLWQNMQQIEFASLIGSGGVFIEKGNPVMCNAANMAFNRLTYNEFNANNDASVSGDDVFLMHHIHAKYPSKVRFLKSTEASVLTNGLNDFGSFIQQRLRWAGKWKHYKDKNTKVMAFAIWGLNFAFILAPFLIPVYYFMVLFVVKSLLEFWFLKKVMDLSLQKIQISAFLCLLIFYPIYVVVFGAISGRLKYNWKGRNVQ